MKKLLTLSIAALAVSTAPALADHHEKDGGQHHEKMLMKMDTNGDGIVSKSEFVSHAEKRFTDMDTDGNDQISRDEAQAAKDVMRERMHKMREMRQDKATDSAE